MDTDKQTPKINTDDKTNNKIETEKNKTINHKKKDEDIEIDSWALLDLFFAMKDHCQNQGYNLLDKYSSKSFIDLCKRTSTRRIN